MPIHAKIQLRTIANRKRVDVKRWLDAATVCGDSVDLEVTVGVVNNRNLCSEFRLIFVNHRLSAMEAMAAVIGL